MIVLCTKYCFSTSGIITTFLIHYFIVVMEFLFLSFHRPAPGAAAGAAFLLQACFTRIVSRLLAIRTCAGPFSKGSEGLGRIKCSVFISGCPRTGSAGSLPCALRCGNRPVTIVRLAAGSRRSVKSVTSGHCRNVADHCMDASGLIPRSGDHGDVAGST